MSTITKSGIYTDAVTICLHKTLNLRRMKFYAGVSYRLPEYTKVAFPGQVFLPQRTYTTPPVGSLRPSPEDRYKGEPSDIKCEDNNIAHMMHMLAITYICLLLFQMSTYERTRIKPAHDIIPMHAHITCYNTV